MTETPLDVRSGLSAIARHKAIVMILALVGALGGAAFAYLRPPMPTAVALVLLPPSTTTSTGSPTRDVGTQIAIATSSPVLTKTGQSLSPPIPYDKLRHQVKVKAVSGDVLSFQGTDRHAGQAEAIANGAASQYVSYVTGSINDSAQSAVAKFQQESSQLTQQVASLNAQIATVSARLQGEPPTSPAGQSDASLLGSLRIQQGDASLQLDSVNSQLLQDEATGSLLSGPVTILQHASSASRPSAARYVLWCVIGLTAGLLVGVAGALIRGRRDPRLVTRDEISAAVGVPVVASLPAGRCRSTREWNAMFERELSGEKERWGIRRLLQHLGSWEESTSAAGIVVVSLAGDEPALTIGPAMAVCAASDGVATALAAGSHPAAATLRVACMSSDRSGRPEALATFESPEKAGAADLRERRALSIVAMPVDRLRPVIGSGWDRTVLVVSAGFATADDLARIAIVASESGAPIQEIVVVNPDQRDRSTGMVGEALGLRTRPVARHAVRRSVIEAATLGDAGPDGRLQDKGPSLAQSQDGREERPQPDATSLPARWRDWQLGELRIQP